MRNHLLPQASASAALKSAPPADWSINKLGLVEGESRRAPENGRTSRLPMQAGQRGAARRKAEMTHAQRDAGRGTKPEVECRADRPSWGLRYMVGPMTITLVGVASPDAWRGLTGAPEHHGSGYDKKRD